jgi:sugar lactone lactonase YvrE
MCAAVFSGVSSVALTATPDVGSDIRRWLGCDSVSGSTCTVSATVSNAAVSVEFERPPVIARFAGDGSRCAAPASCGDGGGATGAQLRDPFGVAVYSGGNAFPAGTVFIGDTGDNEVRKVSPDGTITTVAGDGSPCTSPPACGDGGPATSAQLNRPEGVAVDSAGNVYIADSGDNEVRIVGTDGKIGRIAGTGRQCSTRPNCGDDGPATNASLSTPFGIAVDRAGQVFVSDTGDDEARRIDAGGIITRVAGDGRECSTPPNCGDGGPATSAHLTSPLGVAIGPRGQVYIADGADYEVRVVDIGSITGFAGNGTPCTFAPGCGDGGPATGAKVNPAGIAVDPSGNLYITDAANDEVRKVSAGDTTEDRTITRIAGDGTECTSPSSCGDGSPAISAEFNLPNGVAADPAGSVYIADVGDNEVRKVGSPVP